MVFFDFLTTIVIARVLVNLLAASIIPLLAWLLANSAAKPYSGVKR